MAQIFHASINLALVDKSEIWVNDKGDKYLTLRLVFKSDEPDKYGSVGFIAQRLPKGKEDAHPKKGILGNIKVQQQQQQQAPQQAEEDAPF